MTFFLFFWWHPLYCVSFKIWKKKMQKRGSRIGSLGHEHTFHSLVGKQFCSFINFLSNSDRYWTNSPIAASARSSKIMHKILDAKNGQVDGEKDWLWVKLHAIGQDSAHVDTLKSLPKLKKNIYNRWLIYSSASLSRNFLSIPFQIDWISFAIRYEIVRILVKLV